MREAECAEQLQGHLKDGTLVLQRGVALMADGSFEAVREAMESSQRKPHGRGRESERVRNKGCSY